MKLVYLPSAQRDLIWFYEYYTSVFPEGADKALEQFDAIAELLLVNPFLGKRALNDTREMVIYRTPFSYIYRIADTRIEVLRIWDNRQDSLA